MNLANTMTTGQGQTTEHGQKRMIRRVSQVSHSSMSSSPINDPKHDFRHFPFKLYDMLEAANDLENGSRAVSWAPDGLGFFVHDRDILMKEVVPMFFKQTKFSSFTRQLNLWGFQMIVIRCPNTGAWCNENFIRGRPEKLENISRVEIKGAMKHVVQNALGPHANAMHYLEPVPSSIAIGQVIHKNAFLPRSNTAMRNTVAPHQQFHINFTNVRPLVPNYEHNNFINMQETHCSPHQVSNSFMPNYSIPTQNQRGFAMSQSRAATIALDNNDSYRHASENICVSPSLPVNIATNNCPLNVIVSAANEAVSREEDLEYLTEIFEREDNFLHDDDLSSVFSVSDNCSDFE